MSGKAEEIRYSGGDLANVRQWALFGRNSISREALFMRGWYYDSFERKIKAKIGWLDIIIKAIEEL